MGGEAMSLVSLTQGVPSIFFTPIPNASLGTVILPLWGLSFFILERRMMTQVSPQKNRPVKIGGIIRLILVK